MSKVEWLDERQQCAWRSLQFMQMRLEAALNRQLMADAGLSGADYAVLVRLTDEPEGRLRIFALADEIGWERSRLSHHLNRMEKRGLVRKMNCDSDRRGAFVVLTAEGRRAIEAAAPCHVATVRRLVIDQLDPEELDAVGAAAEKVLAAIEQSEG